MDEIDGLKARALDEIATAASSEELNAARITVLGRNGTLTVRLRALKNRDDEAAVQARRVLNGVKTELTRALGKRRQALKTAAPEPASKTPEPKTADPRRSLMTAWFLGPKSENATLWQESFQYIFQDYVNWRRNYFPTDPVVVTRERRRDHYEWIDTLNGELDGILARLKAHYPFYSPRYIAHMLSEQTLPSVLGYFAGMLYNPNNVTDEAAPVTVELELEAGQLVAAMLGFNPSTAWTHICSGGTAANIEALWVARTVQFVPFMVREHCIRAHEKFLVKTPDETEAADIRDLDDATLIRMKPATAAFMLRKLTRQCVGDGPSETKIERVTKAIAATLASSKYNVSNVGLPSVCEAIGMKPVVLVSAGAHYSVRKAANALGYGERAVTRIPVDRRFRIDVAALKDAIFELPREHYLAAVIGIVGTTEEGAVDPINAIKELRDQLEHQRNASFWLHVDAAWGGYVRALFRGHTIKHESKGLTDLCKAYAAAIGARERTPAAPYDPGDEHRKRGKKRFPFSKSMKQAPVAWDDPDVYAAYLAMADADSITVDPHKLGYVPYPAGMVSFRHGVVTDHVRQKAHYIHGGSKVGAAQILDEPGPVKNVGPYILEGSKPGAAATACWLAHKTIPLDIGGHGKIVKTSLLNAQRLARYLREHRHVFREVDKSIFPESRAPWPFSFEVLTQPDTNVIVFVAVPMEWYKARLRPVHKGLAELNELNEGIHRILSLGGENRPAGLPYGQRFFLSKTEFEHTDYGYGTLAALMEFLGVTEEEYRERPLFVLRSTVMNPFYYAARQVAPRYPDYLWQFVENLHEAARTVIAEMNAKKARDENRDR